MSTGPQIFMFSVVIGLKTQILKALDLETWLSDVQIAKISGMNLSFDSMSIREFVPT